MERSIRRFAWVSLIFVYLVITAGSIVRMTGSGMGCPDWPKCFGYTIPPTETSQVAWEAGRDFRRGQMIVHDIEYEGSVQERLLRAREHFTSGERFDERNWEVYTKHDYTTFNATHTWIEFINRLIGALTGIPVLILFVISLIFGVRSRKWTYFLLAAGGVFMLGFEAWLGKLVVDGNLIPGSITIHMFGSMVLVVLLLVIIRRKRDEKQVVQKRTRRLLLATFVLTIIQILLGTQVREEVDVIAKSGLDRSDWISQLPIIFEIHRSFSWLLLILAAAWLFYASREKSAVREQFLAGALMGFQLLAGVILTYAGMPQFLQPAHLVAGILLFGVLWSASLKVTSKGG